MGLKRASHAVYDTAYHLVWCPKCRKKIFAKQEIRERAEQLIKEICEEYGIEVEEVVRIIKSISERIVPRIPVHKEEALVGRKRRILCPDGRRPYDSANH